LTFQVHATSSTMRPKTDHLVRHMPFPTRVPLKRAELLSPSVFELFGPKTPCFSRKP